MSACCGKRLERRVRLSLLFAVALLTACGSPEATRIYFEMRRPSFERIVEVVAACRPTHHYVSVDRDEIAEVRCAVAGRDIDAVRTELRSNGFRHVFYYGPSDNNSEQSRPFQVDIGDSNTDCRVGIVYESDADPDGGRHIYSAFADESERYPLTGPPHHWFCESIGF